MNTFSYNTVNQLTSEQSGGQMRFFGTLNEAATVTINGQATPVSGNKEFDGTATVVSGSNTVTVTAMDYSNNTKTNKYQVNASGLAKSFSYDNNGNVTADGTFTYEWDAENSLRAVVNGTLRSEFTYDGLSRRVRIVEKNGITVTGDKWFLWVGNEIIDSKWKKMKVDSGNYKLAVNRFKRARILSPITVLSFAFCLIDFLEIPTLASLDFSY